MNRLWIRLSLAFSAAVMVSLLIFMIGSLLVIRTGVPFNYIVREIEAPGGLADNLTWYYDTNQSWTGVESYLDNRGFALGFPPDETMTLSLADANGTIIAGYQKGERLDRLPVLPASSTSPVIIGATFMSDEMVTAIAGGQEFQPFPAFEGGSTAPERAAGTWTITGVRGSATFITSDSVTALAERQSVPAGSGTDGGAITFDGGATADAGVAVSGATVPAARDTFFEAVPNGHDMHQEDVIVIENAGRPGGYLKIARRVTRPMPGPFEMLVNYLSSVMGTAAVIAGVVSVFFGILVSRGLTAPLNRLADAARAIEARKLHRRVKVEGTTEIAAVAQAFNDMADSVQQATMLRQNLVADVAHELRTPLSVLQGNLRAIIDDVYPMSKQEISRLYDQTRLLSRLVNDLHELSQAEAHQLALHLQEFDLAVLVHEQAGMFAALAEDEGLKVNIDAPQSGVWVEANQSRLVQVLNNLLSNALQHTPSGGCIQVCLKAGVSSLSLVVSDTGEGIDPRHVPYLFERFYRADTGRSRLKGGAGLGLAIARALVQEHGGTIEVSSGGAGQGSTFTVTLPQ